MCAVLLTRAPRCSRQLPDRSHRPNLAHHTGRDYVEALRHELGGHPTGGHRDSSHIHPSVRRRNVLTDTSHSAGDLCSIGSVLCCLGGLHRQLYDADGRDVNRAQANRSAD